GGLAKSGAALSCVQSRGRSKEQRDGTESRTAQGSPPNVRLAERGCGRLGRHALGCIPPLLRISYVRIDTISSALARLASRVRVAKPISGRILRTHALGMARNKTENCVVEFLRVRVRRAVSAVRKLDEFGARDQSCKLATEVGRGDDIVLGAKDERRLLQFRQ